ncbi:MAG: hypothetical protein J0M12_14975, partial [Deltaproteobacteria bacterium]|nr:hypothetical protein [Deltaproteobacteria bacterium]
SAAEATLGLPSALEVLRANPTLAESGDTAILARRERCGVKIVESALRGEEISDELTTEYAALEYAAFGMQLGAAESQEAPNLDYLQRLQAEHVRFQDSLKGIFSDYPGLAQTLDASADEFRVYARVAGISQVSAQHGEKLGLLYGASSDAVVRRREQLEERHAAYLKSQQEFLSQHPAAAEQVQAAKESGIRRGIDTMESVRKSVQQLQAGIEGLGTNEEKCFAALQGRSPAEVKLIRDLYKERCGESLELSVEGDFSEAELDKMHALLVSDHIGVAAADANIALSGFWGVDQDRLRAVLRSLENTSRRTEFKQRFDSKYAGNFYRANGEDEPPTQASSFEQVLSFQMSGDSLLAARSLFEGDFHRADAALLHADLDSFWGKDAAAAAKRLEGFTTSTGRLDSARVDAVALAFSKEYGTALRSDAQQIEGPQGRWLVALVDGDEVDAAAHKLRFAMGNSVDGTEETMLREPFTMPTALQARLHAEEQSGAVSEQTRTELFEWSQFREAVVQRYSDADMYPTRDLLVDLRSELNDHHFRMVKTLINGGLLSKADLIADACAGAGTDEAVVLKETAHLSKLQAQALAEDFEKSGYGNLRTVLRSELSGDEEFDALENVDGLPESSLEMLQYAQRRARHEDSGILSGLVWGGEREEMRQDLALLDKAISGNADAHEIDALYRRFGVSASAFREQKNFVSDVIVNTGTTVIMVGGTVVMIVGSGGTATPGAVAMWSIYLAGTAGVVRAGTKWAIRGEGYGNEELALDGGIMLIDMASASLVAKIPVGRIAAQRLEVLLGEIAAQRGAAVIAEDGTKITGEAMLRYLTQSSRGLRMVVGATQGSIDGAIFAPIQTAGITALHEQTWQDGFGTGMLRIGEASLQSVPAGVTVGGISGASMAFRTPIFIKNGQPLSLRESAKASQDASLTESGRELLLQRETSKGFLTRGDVADARLSSTGVGPERSAELIAGMKNSTQTRFTEGDIKLFETKLRQQGTLSKLDEHLILDTSPNQYVASISEKEIQKRVVATKREVLKLELQSSVQGLASSQREGLQSQLSTVQDRLLALEDTLRHIAAAKASSATRASGSQLEVAGTGSSLQEKPRENADPSAAENTELRSQVAAQEELVARLERDLLDPKTAKFKEVIEESLGKQREILGDLKRSAANTADPLPTESSAASSSSEEGNPWAYDPSESFAKELEARARGDFDEPLDNGWRTNEPFPRDPTPGSYGSDGPALQRAPQRARTRVMVAELPEPQAARTSSASRAQIDDLGVVASRTELDLGQALFEEALVKAPAVETEAVLTVKPKVSPKPAASPSIEEILQPQFDQAIFDPAAAPHTATESKTLTPMLALGRVIKPALGTLTQSGNSAERRAKHDSPKPATSPQVLTEEALKKSATKTTREGRGIGTEVDERQIAENERVHRIEEKKHKQEMARSEKKGGARLRFSKVIDALGDEDLIIEDEEAGQV